MRHNSPLISVILPLYNAENYIQDAVVSILNQTYKNFELIIIDDGSTDNSAMIVKEIEDNRIRFFSQKNSGMAAALNYGIQMGAGEFIARQDADDISYPERFQKQIDFLISHPEYAMVGTWARIISDNSEDTRRHEHPSDNLLIKLFLLFDNPFVHSSVLIRKSCLQTTGLYDISKSSLIQDYDLWSRIARNFFIANIPEILQEYREVSSGISQTTNNAMERVIEQSIENMNYYLNNPSPSVIEIANIGKSRYKLLNKKVSINEIKSTFYSLTDKIAEINIGAIEDFKLRREKYISFFEDIKKRHTQFGPLYFLFYRVYKKAKKLTSFN